MLLLLLLSVLTVMLLLLRGVTVGVTGKGRFRAISGRFRAKSGRFQAIPSDFKRFRAISSAHAAGRGGRFAYCWLLLVLLLKLRLNVGLLLLKSLLFLTLLLFNSSTVLSPQRYPALRVIADSLAPGLAFEGIKSIIPQS